MTVATLIRRSNTVTPTRFCVLIRTPFQAEVNGYQALVTGTAEKNIISRLGTSLYMRFYQRTVGRPTRRDPRSAGWFWGGPRAAPGHRSEAGFTVRILPGQPASLYTAAHENTSSFARCNAPR